MLFPRTKTNLTICVPLLAGFLGLALLSIPTTKLHVCTKATGWLVGWLACLANALFLGCMLVACLLFLRPEHRTWNELKSWQEKFLITTWLAAIGLVGWILPAAVRAANGGLQVCVSVPSASDLSMQAIVSTQRISYILHQRAGAGAAAAARRSASALTRRRRLWRLSGYWGCDAPTNQPTSIYRPDSDRWRSRTATTTVASRK